MSVKVFLPSGSHRLRDELTEILQRSPKSDRTHHQISFLHIGLKESKIGPWKEQIVIGVAPGVRNCSVAQLSFKLSLLGAL
jgi:hypothetical protein